MGTIATGAAAVGLTTIAPSLSAFAGETKFDPKVYGDPEEMFKKITGKHRVVYDSTTSSWSISFCMAKNFFSDK